MIFEVRTNYTIEDFAAYWREFRLKSPGRKPPKQASGRAQKIAAWILVLAGGMIAAMGFYIQTRPDTGWSPAWAYYFCVSVWSLRSGACRNILTGYREHGRIIRNRENIIPIVLPNRE